MLLVQRFNSANGIAWSCSQLYDVGLRKNDVYAIDADGPLGPQATMHVNCSLDETAAKTIVHHDQEAGKTNIMMQLNTFFQIVYLCN